MSEEKFNVLSEEDSRTSDWIKVWKILATIATFGIIAILTGIIICTISDDCRNHIPTMSNMLNATITSPYVVFGMTSGMFVHGGTVFCLFGMTKDHVWIWSWAQVIFAGLTCICLLITMFVFPFTGWERNWANVSVILCVILWMITIMVCLYRYYRRKIQRKRVTLRFLLFFFSLFVACVIVYVVLRSIGSLHIVPKDDGILVVELVGGISFFLFEALCIFQIVKLELQFRN